jgi:hypothetical protein
MNSPGNRSIPELFSDAVGQLAKLVGNEFELARAELSEKAGQAGRSAAMNRRRRHRSDAGIGPVVSCGVGNADTRRLLGTRGLSADRRRCSAGFDRVDRNRLEPPFRRCPQTLGDAGSGATRQGRGEGDDTMSEISDKTSGFVRDLGEAALQNPLSAALIGMGVLWLFTGGRTAERPGEFVRRSGFDRIPDAANDAFEAARSTFSSGADAIGDRMTSAKDSLRDSSVGVLDNANRGGRDYADTASEYVNSMPGAGEVLETVRSNLADVFRAQPLALGAIGLAIGAGIAAALPPSELETTYLGETSDTVKAKAADFAAEQTARATTVAGAVMGAVTEEARKQGLTVEDAKSAAVDISSKVGRVADAAGKGISERMTPQPNKAEKKPPAAKA